jgi:hypothetical protein
MYVCMTEVGAIIFDPARVTIPVQLVNSVEMRDVGYTIIHTYSTYIHTYMYSIISLVLVDLLGECVGE